MWRYIPASRAGAPAIVSTDQSKLLAGICHSDGCTAPRFVAGKVKAVNSVCSATSPSVELQPVHYRCTEAPIRSHWSSVEAYYESQPLALLDPSKSHRREKWLAASCQSQQVPPPPPLRLLKQCHRFMAARLVSVQSSSDRGPARCPAIRPLDGRSLTILH